MSAFSLLLLSPQVYSQDSTFYSVESALKSLSINDIGTSRPLQIPPPPVLYHWLSLNSLNRLFNGNFHPTQMPLKVLGNDKTKSILTTDASALRNVPGLFAWQNPVGATMGGVSEIYGNHEAVLAMKIKPEARVGIIVTQNGIMAEKLADPLLPSQYDLILHVNLDESKARHWVEWVLINPKIVISYSTDPNETIRVIEEFKEAVEHLEKARGSHWTSGSNYIEMINGPQHSQLSGFIYSDSHQLKTLEEALLANANRLPEPIKRGWLIIGNASCNSVFAP